MYSKLEGSFRPTTSDTTLSARSNDENATVTIVLRRKNELTESMVTGGSMSPETHGSDYSAREPDADLVTAFTTAHQLTTLEVNLERRTLVVSGKLSDFENAFHTTISEKKDGDNTYRVLSDNISVPVGLADIITGVFGLDNQPVASPMIRIAKIGNRFIDHEEATRAYFPSELARAYGFPAGYTGAGKKIVIIEFDGGYRPSEIAQYFVSQGINGPVDVQSVSINGASNGSVSNEVTLDIEIAGAIAPGAQIKVYFAPNNDSGYLAALHQAIEEMPASISISWASPENKSYTQFLDTFNEVFKTAASLGITVCASSGDRGSDAGVGDGAAHVYFPACSPYVLGCGGTKLYTDDNGAVTSEEVWNEGSRSASGGGVSAYFPVPDYQLNAQIPVNVNDGFAGRGVPDVAGDADTETGYKVLIKGRNIVVGGTSATAPLFAGLIALLNERAPTGFINPLLYAAPALCRDITVGDNITTRTGKGYQAGVGWDGCSGLGVFSNV